MQRGLEDKEWEMERDPKEDGVDVFYILHVELTPPKNDKILIITVQSQSECDKPKSTWHPTRLSSGQVPSPYFSTLIHRNDVQPSFDHPPLTIKATKLKCSNRMRPKLESLGAHWYWSISNGSWRNRTGNPLTINIQQK